MSMHIETLTAQIAAAYVANNPLSLEQLPTLVRSLHGTLASLGTPGEIPLPVAEPAPAEAAAKPAVPLGKSVFPNHIVCLHCGEAMTMLKRHAHSAHGQTPDQYRVHWGLPGNYPMTAPDYSKLRTKLAKASGLGKIGRR